MGQAVCEGSAWSQRWNNLQTRAGFEPLIPMSVTKWPISFSQSWLGDDDDDDDDDDGSDDDNTDHGDGSYHKDSNDANDDAFISDDDAVNADVDDSDDVDNRSNDDDDDDEDDKPRRSETEWWHQTESGLFIWCRQQHVVNTLETWTRYWTINGLQSTRSRVNSTAKLHPTPTHTS